MNRFASSIALPAALALAGAAGAQEIIHVHGGAPPGGDGSSWAAAFRDLQDALAVAGSGDEVWVAAGTYTPAVGNDVNATFTMRIGVALYGGFAGTETSRDQRDWEANPTSLSGDINQDDVYGNPVWYIGWNVNTPNSLHVVTATGVDESAILDGFTIREGRAVQTWGGGIVIDGGSPTIRNCTFFRNLAGFSSGAAMYAADATLDLTGCTFSQNWAHLGRGAAIQVAASTSMTATGCVFSENRCTGDASSGVGGAIDHESSGSLTLTACLFEGNVAESFWPSGGPAGGYGGAIHHLFGELSLDRCTFIGNRSNAGGAVWTWRSASVTNCLFRGNQAPEYQAAQGGWGGIGGALGASSFTGSLVDVVNCTVVANTATRGAGIRMVNSAGADVANCVLWGNSDEFGMIGPSQIQGTGARSSCIQNMLVGQPGEDPPDPADFPESFDSDPLFVNQAGGDLHLAAGSPCIDRGDNTALSPDLTLDLDGLPRFADDPATQDAGIPDGSRLPVDVGAFEVQPPALPGDVDGDGFVGIGDLLALLAAWGPCSPPPEACPADFDGDGAVGINDLLALLAAWT